MTEAPNLFQFSFALSSARCQPKPGPAEARNSINSAAARAKLYVNNYEIIKNDLFALKLFFRVLRALVKPIRPSAK